MRTAVYIVAICAALAAAAPAPAPEPQPDPAAAPAPQPDPADDTPEIIEIIAPAASAQETLATLNLGAPGSELSERNKRTIGILRQLFPTLTQIIEQKVQQITSFVLQTFGPVLLRTFLGNRNGGNNSGGGGTIELDDDDDDDDDEEETSTGQNPRSTTVDNSPAASILSADNSPVASVPSVDSGPSTDSSPSTESGPSTNGSPSTDSTPDPDEADDADDADADVTTTTTTTTSTTPTAEGARRRRRALYFLPNAIAEENQLLSGAESQQAEVRVAFGGQDLQPAASEDQLTAAQTNAASIDEISLDDGDNSEENRNKRFLSFGGGAGASGGGSGNFLFDIVRLVAGSSSGSAGGEAAAEGDDAGAAKGDNLTEGVPGPITRLFIIANRGIANLIQDLILRIAQTSERIVNFKARLITSII